MVNCYALIGQKECESPHEALAANGFQLIAADIVGHLNCYGWMVMTSPTAPRQAMHRQIAQALRNDIEAGILRDGERLPSTRELASQWNVSVFTITQAMDLLTAEGLVHSKDRSARVITAPYTAAAPKGLQLPTPQFVLVGGYAGSGKTEFGRVLARQTGWTILDKDTITRPLVQRWLEDLGASLDDRESPTYMNKIRPYEYEALNAAIEENIECGNSIISTAPYLHELTDLAWIDRTQARANDLNADLSIVWVTCGADTMNLYLRRRAAARDRWKLANWPTYLASVDTTFVPPVPHTLIQNDPDSQPLQVQARNFVKSIRAQAGQQQGT